MTRESDVERAVDRYLAEGATVLPDWVLDDALHQIEDTPQRRAWRVPWRFPEMPTFLRPALVGATIVAVLIVGGALVVTRGPTNLGGSGVDATPTPEVSVAEPTPEPSPTLALPLTRDFTSSLHGISLSYPGGWTAQAATEPWTGAEPIWSEPTADFLYDPVLRDHLFLKVASQPIGDSSPDEWLAEHMSGGDCTGAEQTTVDGATGLIGPAGCNVAAVTTDGRGYIIVLHTSPDEAWISPTYNRAWFEEVLATVELNPRDAVD